VKISIGPGPRNARTLPGTGLRFYTWQGLEYPSVTTIRRLAGVPHGLHQWQLGEVAKAAIDLAPEIMQAQVNPDQQERDALLTKLRADLRAAATAERDAAARLGIAVHDAAAAQQAPSEASPEVRARLGQFHDWLAVSGAQVLATEFQCWNLSVGYAGTADLLVRLEDGSIWLVDLKTGKGVYGEHALQLIAYLMAEFVGADDVVDEEVSALLHTASGMAVLHLADDGWEFRAMAPDADTWRAFRGLLAFATWMRVHERADDVTIAARKGGIRNGTE
jgi:hypothetical protein